MLRTTITGTSVDTVSHFFLKISQPLSGKDNVLDNKTTNYGEPLHIPFEISYAIWKKVRHLEGAKSTSRVGLWHHGVSHMTWAIHTV